MRFFRYRFSRQRGLLIALILLSILSVLGAAALYAPPAEGTQQGIEAFRAQFPLLARLLNMRVSPRAHEFLVSLLFGLLLPVVSISFGFLSVRRLQLMPLSTGEMTWFLLSPRSRAVIPMTHFAAGLLGLLLQYAIIALTAWLARFIWPLWSPDVTAVIRTCLGAALMSSLPLGAAVYFACTTKTGKLSPWLHILTVLFLAIRMMANLRGPWDYLRYLTPFSLFDAWGVLAAGHKAVLLSFIPLMMGTLLALIGALRFCSREIDIGEMRE